MDSDVGYYSRRAADEQRAAMNAGSDEARSRHSQIAAAYIAKTRLIRAAERRSTLYIVRD